MNIRDFEECSICEAQLPGIISVNNLVFCASCERRELNHNIKMVIEVQKLREDGKCKFFGMCEYKQENGYTCTHEGEANHYCGKYRELNK